MRSTAAALLLAFVVTGCSTASREAPPAAPDRAGAPEITSPRELSSRATDPCRTLLSPAQVRRLGYDQPGDFRRDILGAPTCTWRERKNAGRRSSVSVIPVDIMSGPQVQTCTTTVGVADGQSLQLNTGVGLTDGRRDGDPCAEGHRVAEEIVSTLPPQSE